jgi:methionine-rich copper-binding protein CopC
MRHVPPILLALATAACLAAVPTLVLGHIELTSSSPAAGDKLDTAPRKVSVTFDDELDPDLSSFKVTDAAGTVVGRGDVDLTVADRNVMNGKVIISSPGVYTVRYTVAGVDGHVQHGTFRFGFRAAVQPDTSLRAPRSPFLPTLGLILLAVGCVVAARRRRRA